MQLRNYQEKGKDDIRAVYAGGSLRVVLCGPTGSGKTVTFASIGVDAVKLSHVVMIVVDRKELLQQAQKKLIEYGLMPTIITGGSGEHIKLNTSYVATVQTLMKRSLPHCDLIIIDECHKTIFDKVLECPKYKDSWFIGATATPIRKGRQTSLQELYGNIVEPTKISELIKLGFLSPAFTFGVKMDTSGIKRNGNDFDKASMFDAFNKTQLYSGVVKAYEKHTPDTKAIVFNVNVEHSLNVAAQFTLKGYQVAHLDGKTSKEMRERILSRFDRGEIQILCNCDVLTTGFDQWDIETVIINRATTSLVLWLQMAGRGSRITPPHLQGNMKFLQKEHFNLIDMGGNVERLGFWENDREWSLTHRKKSDDEGVAPVKECDNCDALNPVSARVCRVCNTPFPPPKEKEEVEGNIVSLTNPFGLPEQLRKDYSLMTVEEIDEVRTLKGYKMGWAVRQVIAHPTITLEDYAAYKEYRPSWVQRAKEARGITD